MQKPGLLADDSMWGFAERLDPALIRPGRMDLHIELTYCGMDGFRDLCWTYLGITEHHLFPQIEERLLPSARLTPAQVAAVLEAHADDTSAALLQVLAKLSPSDGLN